MRKQMQIALLQTRNLKLIKKLTKQKKSSEHKWQL